MSFEGLKEQVQRVMGLSRDRCPSWELSGRETGGKAVVLGGGDHQSFYNVVAGLPGREAGTACEDGPRSVGSGGRVASAANHRHSPLTSQRNSHGLLPPRWKMGKGIIRKLKTENDFVTKCSNSLFGQQCPRVTPARA